MALPNVDRPPPPPRVLVVNDDPDVLVVVGRLLSRVGVDAVPAATCATCAAARAAAAGGRVTAAVVGSILPDGDGLALVGELRRLHGCRVVVLGTAGEAPDRLPAGVDAWLTRPLDDDDAALRAALARLAGAAAAAAARPT
jgi:two-component system KDP operon response regulator KdpE